MIPSQLLSLVDGKSKFCVALKRDGGAIARCDIPLPEYSDLQQVYAYVERHVKFMLWANGGYQVYVSGPAEICQMLQMAYSYGGVREFDVKLMEKVYGEKFAVICLPQKDMPEQVDNAKKLGGHMDGCRIGFDLGASDFKLAAVKDGEVLFTTEIPWNPVPQTDPQYQISRLSDGLKMAAGYLPQVDAIGGSAAGIYVDNEPRIASLFRSISDADFQAHIQPMFKNLEKEWGVPLVLANDGDVTALTGSICMKRNGILGIAMGSSEAVGYVDANGRITGALHELAFAPVDHAGDAPMDEWSGDVGVGALYFSQQAVNRHALQKGYEFSEDTGLPERLKIVQADAEAGKSEALDIFETIGQDLGTAIPLYSFYYKDMENVMLLGRVLSGTGGEIIMDNARKTLKQNNPVMAEKLDLFMPDETTRRHGQAVAAAGLPTI